MFKNETNDTVSRRNVLKTTGGLIAGSTALASLGTGVGAAETEDELRLEVRELNEEYIAAEVYIPPNPFPPDENEFQNEVFLGHAEQFVIHEDGEWVSLPEDTEGLANPVEVERLDERTYGMYFRTASVDEFPEADGEEVMLGLGVFPERTVSGDQWDYCPGHRDY
jgi:hypothetical protein